MILAALLMAARTPRKLTKYDIEIKAHEYGMMYPDEIKAYFNDEKKE